MNQTSMKTRVVGVDISLGLTTMAIVDIRGNILAKDSFVTTEYPNIADFASVLCERIVNMLEANGGYESVRSIGISAASANFRTGCIENAPNMPWKGVIPLCAMLRDRIGLAVALGNNAYVRALGEHAYGAAHGMRNFILVTLGNGMGSCIFSNGQPHLGADGFAGEIGHTCAEHGGRLCGCGNRGCLERYTAAQGVIQTAHEVMAESDKPSMMRQVEKLTPKMIAAFCDQGDELSVEVFRRTGYMLGLGLANYASILNPEAIIITGGVAHAGDWLFKSAEEAFNAHVFHNIEGKVKFLASLLDENEHDLLGASVLAWKVKEYSLFK